MPQIIVLPHPQLCPEGTVIDAPEGKSLCEALVESDVEIEHACEMSCACTTCHVVIREGFQSLNASSDDEEDLLDAAWGLEATHACPARSNWETGHHDRDSEIHDQSRSRKSLNIR
jgi:2Fe-2S ferredoxin